MKSSLSRNLLPLSVAFLLTALTLGVAPAAHAQDGACGVIDSPCTLAEISAQALVDSGAADVVEAGFSSASGAGLRLPSPSGIGSPTPRRYPHQRTENPADRHDPNA